MKKRVNWMVSRIWRIKRSGTVKQSKR
jgi:hypothetical protein